MKLKEAHPSRLFDRNDRACAKLARIARGDTVYGGARAMVIAERAKTMGCHFPANDVVSEVYSLSNYTCGRYGAYECPECGSAHLGQEAAWNCCQQNDESEE